MRYESRLLRLQTDSEYSERLPLDVCGDLLRQLKPLLTYSVRMAVEGSSVGFGRMPGWLASASDVRLAGYGSDRDDTLIQLAAPTLGDAAPELYEQRQLWPTKPDPLYTAVDVFSDVVGDVALQNLDSVRYDRHLLRKLAGLRRVFSDHLRTIVLSHESRAVDSDIAQSAERIAECTPPPQEVRVVGQLDMIRKSTRSFGVQLDDGSEIHGVLEDNDGLETMREFFGRRVLVLGKAVYRPSGSLLRIDTHAVEDGQTLPSIFSRVPPPRRRPMVQRSRRISAGRGWAPLAKYFGAWPGDETDERWAEMLVELKK